MMRVARRCFREPIPEIWDAARLLDAAATAYLLGQRAVAGELVVLANIPAVGEWGYSIWGAKSPYLQLQEVRPKSEGMGERTLTRMPSRAQIQLLHMRDGFHCRFCGIPVIRAEVRRLFVELFPELRIWGPKNHEQHVAFQTLWAQYDHVVPHSAGGNNEPENLILTCGPCNFGRMAYTLEEVNLLDPRERSPSWSHWDGLERLLAARGRESTFVGRPSSNATSE
jgi:hypothetical protein